MKTTEQRLAYQRNWGKLRRPKWTPEQREIYNQKQRKHQAEYRSKNREKVRAYQKEWARKPENRKKLSEAARRWREVNPEKYAASQAKHKAKFPSQKSLPFWKRSLNPHWPRPIAEAMRRLGWTVTGLAKRLNSHQVWVTQALRNYRGKTFNSQQREQIQHIFAEAGEYVDVLDCWPQNPEPIELPQSINPRIWRNKMRRK